MKAKKQETEKLIDEIEKMTASLFFGIWANDLSKFKSKISEYLELSKEDDVWDKRVIACIFAVENFFEHDCFDGPPCKGETGLKAFGNLAELKLNLAESNMKIYETIMEAMDKKQDTLLGIVPDDKD